MSEVQVPVAGLAPGQKSSFLHLGDPTVLFSRPLCVWPSVCLLFSHGHGWQPAEHWAPSSVTLPYLVICFQRRSQTQGEHGDLGCLPGALLNSL